MKRIASLLWAFMALSMVELAAQTAPTLPAREALAHPENTAVARVTPRSALLCYPSREQMEVGTKSDFALPLTSWQADTLAHGIRYTSKFKRNYRYDDKEVILRVEGATGAVSIDVNDKEIGYSASGIGRLEFDLTKHLVENNNTISITVHRDYVAREIEPATDGLLTFTRATILTPPRVAVADYIAKTSFNKQGDGLLNLGIVMQSFLLNSKDYTIYYELYSPEGKMVSSANKELTTRMLSRDTVSFFARIPAVERWSPSTPNLYRLVVYTRHENRIKEFTTSHIGFRTVAMNKGEVVVNDEVVTIKGTPLAYTSEEQTTSDIRRLKAEGYNLVFTSRPQLDEFYALCDREGMMVCCSADITTPDKDFASSPSNNPAWKSTYLWRAMAVYHATKLHPSVVMFSLAHDAQNGICLYESYLAMKALAGETRPIVYPNANGEWNSDL